jgi:hypothetical protein
MGQLIFNEKQKQNQKAINSIYNEQKTIISCVSVNKAASYDECANNELQTGIISKGHVDI